MATNLGSHVVDAKAIETPGASPPAKWRPLFLAGGIYALTRIVVVAVAWLAPQHRDRSGPDWWSEIPLLRWDSGHYYGILTVGYPDQINDTTAFFPGYPLVAWPLSRFVGPQWALVVTANLFGFLAALLLFAWTRRHWGERAGWMTVALWACYPPALFLSVGYADSLLACCVAGVLLLLSKRHFVAAAVLSGFAAAVRPPGIALAVITVFAALARTDGRSRSVQWARALILGAISSWGLAAHEGYLWQKYGRWDAYFAAQHSWKPRDNVRDAVWKAAFLRPVIVPGLRPVEVVLRGQWPKLVQHGTWDAFFNLVLLGVGIAGLIRPGGRPRAVFLLPILALVIAWLPDPVTGARLYGISRYQLIALPCFALIGSWLSKRGATIFGVLLVALLALQCVFMAGFVDWQPVG